MSTRRTAALAFVVALAAGAFASSAAAQPAGRIARIGYLELPAPESVAHLRAEFARRLRDLGRIEGQNLIIESRSAYGNVTRLPELAAELVRLDVDVLVTPGTSAALAAKKVTGSLPIVMVFPANPVDVGLVDSLNRPGGNVTGTTSALGFEIFGKQLQILKDAIPGASRVAVLVNPADRSVQYIREIEAAARALDLRIQFVEARGPREFDRAFAAMTRERADAVLLSGTATLLDHRVRLAELARAHKLPSMSNFREYVEAGGLMAYAVNMADFIGKAAVYVDKLLKGAKPADLPVEQPTRFELIVNLGTARQLGITLPQSLLQRADSVIR